jgi:hypothetical protein
MFAEAVACFRSGAYRACILTTWTAVVFDYLAKLRELELAGNGEARTELAQFETARSTNNIATSLRLEREMLDTAATKFELLTPIELIDLKRLQYDRNRCAHPSLQSIDEPYYPTAELARSHMRAAAESFLSRPPLQGREAWDRVWGDVNSEYFPVDENEAVDRLRGRLFSARPSLVRKLVIELTKVLLTRTDATTRVRLRAGLLAAISLRHEDAERLLKEKLDSLVDGVADDALDVVVAYCRDVSLAWGVLSQGTQGRLRAFIEGTSHTEVLAEALHVPSLRSAVIGRRQDLDDDLLVALAKQSKAQEVLDEIVVRFRDKRNFGVFASLRHALRHEELAEYWTAEQRRGLVVAVATNPDIRRYMGFHSLVSEVFDLCRECAAEHEDDWRPVFNVLLTEGSSRALRVARKIREPYPDFPAVAVEDDGEG